MPRGRKAQLDQHTLAPSERREPAATRTRLIPKVDTTAAQITQTKLREKLMTRLLKDEQALYELVWQLLTERSGKERENDSRTRLLIALLGKVMPEQREIASQEPNNQAPVLIQINGLREMAKTPPDDARNVGTVLIDTRESA